MLAAVAHHYGPANEIRVQQISDPIPSRGQVRVRVRASSLNPLDSKLRSGAFRLFLPLRFPAVLGFDLAGEVEALGPGVEGLCPGDRVYGRIEAKTGGGHAELVVVDAGVLDRIPPRLSWEEAASLPLTGMTALQALQDKARLRPGQRLLVVGGAGGVGSMAIQVGRALGGEVTAVVGPGAVPLARGLGAARVLDRTIDPLDPRDGPYDVVFDTVFKQPYAVFAALLAERGVYVTTGFSPGLALRALAARLISRRRIHWLVSRADGGHMRALSAMVAAGHVRPVIDSSWPLAQIREAYARLEAGHAHGKIVLTLP